MYAGYSGNGLWTVSILLHSIPQVTSKCVNTCHWNLGSLLDLCLQTGWFVGRIEDGTHSLRRWEVQYTWYVLTRAFCDMKTLKPSHLFTSSSTLHPDSTGTSWGKCHIILKSCPGEVQHIPFLLLSNSSPRVTPLPRKNACQVQLQIWVRFYIA